jgi:hypothetical protein
MTAPTAEALPGAAEELGDQKTPRPGRRKADNSACRMNFQVSVLAPRNDVKK